ncbi:MAG: FGGY family carbohydrate kinase [Verrucomicrobiota bacterium]
MNTQHPTESYLLGLDLGTSAIKGVLMSRDGDILAEAKRQTSFIRPSEGQIEIDPELHYQNVCRVIRELAEVAPCSVAAIAMAAASGNTLLTDQKGVPLTNIISWMDQRSVANLPEALGGLTVEEVRQIVGWPCMDSFPLAHLAWLKGNASETYRNAAHCCMNTDWLLYRLTGNWIMDHSTATTFHLQDQLGGCYHPPFLNLLDIPENKLSPLTDSGRVAGNITQRAAEDTGLAVGTVVVAGCFDHPAAARSAGIMEPGQLLLSCGTSWVGFFPEMSRQKVVDAGLLCDPFLSDRNGPWGAIFSVPYIGRTIDWYIDHIIAPNEPDQLRVFDGLAVEADPSCHGVRINLQEPPQKIDAARSDISRAVMESAARLIDGKLKEIAAQGMGFKSAVMVGGPSNSPVWPGIVAETTGLELTIGSAHAGARGAAMLAGIGAGFFKDEKDFS